MEEIKLVINEKRSRSAVSKVIISNEVYYKVNYISNVTGNSMQDITEALLRLGAGTNPDTAAERRCNKLRD